MDVPVCNGVVTVACEQKYSTESTATYYPTIATFVSVGNATGPLVALATVSA